QLSQIRRSANRSQRSVGTCRHVRQLRRAVAADTVAALEVTHDFDLLLGKRQTSGSAKAATNGRVVEGPKGRGQAAGATCRQVRHDQGLRAARINAVAERANDANDFVVAPPWIERSLHHDVWRFVGRVPGGVCEVVQTTTRPRNVEEEVV